MAENIAIITVKPINLSESFFGSFPSFMWSMMVPHKRGNTTIPKEEINIEKFAMANHFLYVRVYLNSLEKVFVACFAFGLWLF